MKNPERTLILLLFLFGIATGLPAQKESLLIGPGDLLHLQVYDTPEMEQRARVTDAGTIPFSFLGNVRVVNMTPEQAAKEIERRLVAAGIMLYPQVTVRVDAYATQNVSVIGQVPKPGAYEIDTPRTVVDVLALAGGLMDVADRHITIERHGDREQRIEYYYSNQAAAALTDDPLVYPGDTVVVPKVAIVYVLGDVSKPGGYPFSTNNSRMTVLQAIALAGYANHTAAIGRSKLVRETPAGVQEIDLPVSAIEKGRKPDVPLLPDDVVYVPFSFLRNVAVNGQSILASASAAAVYLH